MIKAKKGLETSKQTRITNFINSGAISGSDDQGINFAYSILTNFINTGMIKGNSKEGVFFNNSRVSIFYNSGTIKNSSKEAVNFTKNSNTIKNFFNKGDINSTNDKAIHAANVSISNFINTGTLSSSGGSDGLYAAAGFSMQKGTITNFINTGTMMRVEMVAPLFSGEIFRADPYLLEEVPMIEPVLVKVLILLKYRPTPIICLLGCLNW
ncbi:hypothetical protein ACEN40_06205 [Campylobacter bilis]|uniref:hypothetical protein n=1 Tax=Campylobacter bilis TaxID=2691918 RepID=UPI0035947333